MKNLGKRNKIILAIAAIVVVVLAGLFILQPPPIDQLFGTTAQLTITPSNASVAPGATIELTVNVSGAVCTWKSSNMSVATVQLAGGNAAVAKGVGLGTTTITVNCVTKGTGSTTLTVAPPPTATPAPLVISPDTTSVRAGSHTTFTTGDASCTWSTSSSLLSPRTGSGASFTVTAGNVESQITASVTATCASGTATETFFITPGGGRQ